MKKKSHGLRQYFADAHNTVTRERIFFKRLSFDLTIAAARAGYHLHLYEPDVDRDGFDIVAEDGETVGWYQTKAALSGAGTSEWKIANGFLRPSLDAGDAYGFDPPDVGRGGGVILIEIDEQSELGNVTYRYTDFDVLVAIAEGYLVEQKYGGRGRPANAARSEAKTLIETLRTEPRGGDAILTKKLFITVERPDDLLALMGLRCKHPYGMFATRQAFGSVTIDGQGVAVSKSPIPETAALHHHMAILCQVQPASPGNKKTVLFNPFKWSRHSKGSA